MSREKVSEDAEFAQLLRSVMADRSDSAPPAADWGPLRSRLHELRRRRRMRSAARVGAGLLAVTAVIAVVNIQLNPGSIEKPEPARPSLTGGAVRGSLRSDSAWLSDFRRQVAKSVDITLGQPDLSGEQWSPPSPAKVQVIFAGDLGGYRLALVTGPWEEAEVTPTPGRQKSLDLQRWFVGPAGAAADDLLPGGVTAMQTSPTLAAQTIQPGSLPNSTKEMKRTGLAVAIVNSQAEADAQLAGPAAYLADGKASLPVQLGSIEATEPGVYTAPVPDDGAYRLVVDGSSPNAGVFQEVHDRDPIDLYGSEDRIPEQLKGKKVLHQLVPTTDFSRPVSGAEPVLPAVLKPQRGGLTPPRDVLRYAFGRAVLFSGLSARDSTYELIFARPGRDTGGNITEWTVMAAVTAPSGARFVSVCEVLTGGRVANNDGVLNAWKVVPKGPLDSLALAWPVSSGGDGKTVSLKSELIRFLGPKGSVSAEFLGPKGQLVGTLAMSGGIEGADFDHKPLSTVRFLDAAGKVLAVAPVGPYLAADNFNPPVMSWPTSTG